MKYYGSQFTRESEDVEVYRMVAYPVYQFIHRKRVKSTLHWGDLSIEGLDLYPIPNVSILLLGYPL